MISSPKTTNKFFEDILLYPSSKVYDWETTLVVAPHPEDESLGCGGAIALLRNMGYRVHILYVTHGNMRMGDELMLTRPLIKKIKEKEAIKALEKLGMTEESATFLHIHNQLVPRKGEPGFEEAVRLCINKLESFMPNTVLLPCRFHPYDDHYATWEIMQDAIKQMPYYRINMIEYMIWKGGKGNKEIMTTDALKPWRLDIKTVMDQKIKAITEHRTQKNDIISWNSNPISSSRLHLGFTQPWETYLEASSV